MTADWTVQRMLTWMTQDFASLQIASPRLDAELLLSHALQCDRVRLYMDMPRPLDAQELAAVRALVVRRRRREPVAYILGRKEFYRHTLEVTRDVLVPRPETELLVDCALDLLPDVTARVLDLCTGSGAVAIALALERAQLEVDASDISEAALAVAARNAERLGVTARVHFHHGDLFAALPSHAQRYALITANPPYIAESDFAALAPDITEHEPKVALVAGPEGFAVLERLCAESAEWLEPAGSVLFEVGQGQAAHVMAMLDATGRFEAPSARKDLAGIDRIVIARRLSS